MRNKIQITEIRISEYRIDYSIEVTGNWKKYFTGVPFFVEYDRYIGDIPKSVAVIPILGTILPLSWIYDAEVIIDDIDKVFYESIPEFKQGYINMYPQMKFKGCLNVENIQDNTKEESANISKESLKNVACMFSGGVDAFETLLTHLEEKPMLISIWGADVDVENEKGWAVVEKHLKETAESNHLKYGVVKSSFRKVLDEGVQLYRELIKISGDGWWHGFHHGIGMLTLVAPISHQLGIEQLYIASSNTVENKGKVTCASDPTIDNYVRFVKCHVIHDGYEFHRVEKIRRICNYVRKNKKKIALRVCWKSTEGDNCCRCEKCWRTILAIYALKENPQDYGFKYSDKELKQMIYEFKYGSASVIIPGYYGEIQRALRTNYTLKEVKPQLRWFYKVNLDEFEKMPCRGKGIFRKGVRYLERRQFI